MSQANKAIKGSLILVVTKISEKLLGLISTLILARLLLPEDFGIIAISLLVIYFMTTVSNSGGREYIVRKDTVDKHDINTFWTLNICLKFGIYIVVILLTPTIVSFYDDERLMTLLPILALSLPITALLNPEIVICQREQNYLPILKIDIIKKTISIVFAISAALYFENYWALIISHLTANLVSLICSYLFLTFRPKLSLSKLKEQWGFSQWMLARSVLGYCRSQLDTLFVSAYYSTSSLGGFHISKYISNMPASDIFAPALEPLLATYSKNKHNKDDLKHQVTLTILVIAVIAIPFTAFMFNNNNELVELILGSKWSEYSALFGLLSLLIIPQTIGYIAGTIITSLGKISLLFYYDIISLALMAVILFFLKGFSLETFTLGKFVIEVVMVLTLFSIGSFPLFGLKIGGLFLLLTVSSGLSFGLAYILSFIDLKLNVFLELSISFIFFGISWLIMCIIIYSIFLRNNHAALHLKHIIERALQKRNTF